MVLNENTIFAVVFHRVESRVIGANLVRRQTSVFFTDTLARLWKNVRVHVLQ